MTKKQWDKFIALVSKPSLFMEWLLKKEQERKDYEASNDDGVA